MQNPNEDTQWNDVLRRKGIIPPKEKEVDEHDIVSMMEQTIQEKSQGKQMSDMTLGELNEAEDDIDEEEERLFEEYKRQRMAELKAAAAKAQYGDVIEITKEDYVREINKAGEGVWVVLHVYKDSIPLCKVLNHHLRCLAQKFPQTKFVKSVSSVCIPNYPDKNLPTIFVYYEGDLKKQHVGPIEFGGMNISQDEFEWMLSRSGAVQTTLEENPRKEVKDVLTEAMSRQDEDDNDW